MVYPHLRDSQVSQVNCSMSLAQDQHPQLVIWWYVNTTFKPQYPIAIKRKSLISWHHHCVLSHKTLDLLVPIVVTL